MLSRRDFLAIATQVGAGIAVTPHALALELAEQMPVQVNDVHSRLNPTYVRKVVEANRLEAVTETVQQARRVGHSISIAGGRHAMGGQQFGTESVLLDTRSMNRIINFDRARGLIEVEAGIQWPALISHLVEVQKGQSPQWSIIQKQTGADRLCIGGALGSNIHGRGLALKPMIDNVESFRLVDARGEVRLCSRTENPELFRLAIGGYGLFGVIASVNLRLMPRRKLQRVVEVIDTDDLMAAFDNRIAHGYLYGDAQFSIDPESDGFLRKCVFSCYKSAGASAVIPATQKQLTEDDWRKLYFLAHDNPQRVFDIYSSYYLSTNGQTYWSDTHQLSTYTDDYHKAVDRQTRVAWPGTEMITEVYVPRSALSTFMATLAEDFRRHSVKVIYGTIRLIERDSESFLAWAKQPYACIVMNLHVAHNPQGFAKAGDDFRRVIDRAIEHGGSYFLTYHRWADREQVEACYPQMQAFLNLKRKYDPKEIFQSDWYRHYRTMYA